MLLVVDSDVINGVDATGGRRRQRRGRSIYTTRKGAADGEVQQDEDGLVCNLIPGGSGEFGGAVLLEHDAIKVPSQVLG